MNAAADMHRFPCMGTEVSVWIDHRDGALRNELYAEVQRILCEFEWRFTRFDPGSELSQVNASREPVVSVSRSFAHWLTAALWAAEWTGGLVDPTLVDAIEHAGYRESLNGRSAGAENLPAALADRDDMHPARPDPAQHWRLVQVDLEQMQVTRPPGLRLDSGGTGKGYGADLVAALLTARLADGTRWFIDCGGDIRLSELPDAAVAHDVHVEHPLSGEVTHRLSLSGGAVATSSVGRRTWRDRRGALAHHLLDPATGTPAWTGVISATAFGTGALQAETLAKWALLSGADAARELLAVRGGLFVHDSGETEVVPISRSVAAHPPLIGKEAA